MVRWRRLALLILAGVMAAAATVLAVAVNVATGGTANWFPPVERHPLGWTAGATAAVAVASLLVWAAQRWYERGLSVLVPAVQRPEQWVVDRPAEVDRIVAALRRSAGTVGVTTAVHGAGGFGKTTVAKMVRADRRVLRRFRGRVYWVTLGRDVGKQALAGLVNGLIGRVEPGREVTSTDARQAAEQLAAVLAAGPDGRWLASVGRDATVRIWDLTADGISAVMRVDSGLGDCAWSPSSQSVARRRRRRRLVLLHPQTIGTQEKWPETHKSSRRPWQPCCDTRGKYGLRKVAPNLTLDFAIFGWTGHRRPKRQYRSGQITQNPWRARTPGRTHPSLAGDAPRRSPGPAGPRRCWPAS